MTLANKEQLERRLRRVEESKAQKVTVLCKRRAVLDTKPGDPISADYHILVLGGRHYPATEELVNRLREANIQVCPPVGLKKTVLASDRANAFQTERHFPGNDQEEYPRDTQGVVPDVPATPPLVVSDRDRWRLAHFPELKHKLPDYTQARREQL